jgi:hypothetical protein
VKAIGWIIGLVLLVVVGVGVYVFLNSGSLIKQAVETLGPQYLGVPVSLGSAEISLTDGSGSLNNLEIGNPSGFAGPPSMRIGRIALALDPSQISSQLVVIKTLAIEGAEVAIIAKGTDTNVQTLMKNLEAGDSAPAESESEAAAMKMIIDTFSFTNAKATLSSDLLGEKTVTIPDIQLTGIGRESSGVTAQQAAKQLLNPILKAATDAAVREGLGVDDLKKSATEKLNESVGEGLKSLTDRLPN